jgi:hypothetical protein
MANLQIDAIRMSAGGSRHEHYTTCSVMYHKTAHI